MLIIVNSAFDEHAKNSDEIDEDQNEAESEITASTAATATTNLNSHSDDGCNGLGIMGSIAVDSIVNVVQDIELAVISIDNSLNSSNDINESAIDGEELDTSDNNTTNNTQTTAECDDRLLLSIDSKHNRNGSGSSNYDDDYEADENMSLGVDEIRSKHIGNGGDYGLKDVQNIEETQKLVNGTENGSEIEDCDYYSDGENATDILMMMMKQQQKQQQEHNGHDDLKKINGGDGIIANHFIGLYFHFFLSLSHTHTPTLIFSYLYGSHFVLRRGNGFFFSGKVAYLTNHGFFEHIYQI